MSNQLYIDGKPATLFQKIIATIIGIVTLIFLAFFGVAIFVVGLGLAAILGVYFMWKTRKIRRQMNEAVREANSQRTQRAGSDHQTDNSCTNEKNGNLYEGEYKEL